MLSIPWKQLGALVAGLTFSFAVVAAEGDKPKEEKKETKAQTTCPVMGGKINKEIFVDHDGKRVYLCCQGCIATFAKDPAKYIKKLEDEGVTLEKTPAKEAPKEGGGDAPKGGHQHSGGGCCP